MSGPNSWYLGVSHVNSGIHAATAAPQPLGINIVCRRVLLVAAAGAAAYVGPQDMPVPGAFPIPTIAADGTFVPLELWVNGLNMLWIQGTGNVYWFAEEN